MRSVILIPLLATLSILNTNAGNVTTDPASDSHQYVYVNEDDTVVFTAGAGDDYVDISQSNFTGGTASYGRGEGTGTAIVTYTSAGWGDENPAKVIVNSSSDEVTCSTNKEIDFTVDVVKTVTQPTSILTTGGTITVQSTVALQTGDVKGNATIGPIVQITPASVVTNNAIQLTFTQTLSGNHNQYYPSGHGLGQTSSGSTYIDIAMAPGVHWSSSGNTYTFDSLTDKPYTLLNWVASPQVTGADQSFSFGDYVQYSIDGGITWTTCSYGSWHCSGSGTMTSGTAATGSCTTIIDSTFSDSSATIPVSRSSTPWIDMSNSSPNPSPYTF